MNMITNSKTETTFEDSITVSPALQSKLGARNIYKVEHFRDGVMLSDGDFTNIVVDAGLDDVLDKYFKGSAYTAAWYVGLTGATPVSAAGDTLASHAGWTEATAYSETARQTLTLGAVSAQQATNTTAKAIFSVSATQTFGGAFLATDSTKGGTTGTLYSIGAFPANRDMEAGDELRLTVTVTSTAV